MTKEKTKELEILQFKSKVNILESKAEGDQGIVEAYVSIFDNVDSYNDIIVKGAFDESLKEKLPKGVWMHDWNQPVAKTLEAREDNVGLYIRGQFNLETQRGREAFSDLKMGIIDEFSIGFVVKEDSWDQETGIRTIKKVKLYEWSPVLAGANPKTAVIDIKDEKPEAEAEPEKEPEAKQEPEEKAGKVLSEKNRKAINSVVSELKSLGDNINSIINPLEKLLALTDEGEKVETIPQEVKTKTKEILRIRQAVKQIDKASEYILRITK